MLAALLAAALLPALAEMPAAAPVSEAWPIFPRHAPAPVPTAPGSLPAPSLRPASAPARPEAAEPFFELLLRIVSGDSLGVWTQKDLRARLLGGERKTRLPLLRWVRSLERSALPPGPTGEPADRGAGAARPVRRWRLELTADLALPMPYSILGYHPGKLLLSRTVEATELDLGHPDLHLPQGKSTTVVRVSDLRAIRIDRGWVVLDVDKVVDRLLGPRLDDSTLTGFLLCRADAGLRGLGLARSREGRLLLGEIDLAADEIRPQGDAVARALSVHARPQIERGPDPGRWPGGGGD